MQLFYNSTIKETDKDFTFDKEESRHIVRVLRKKEEDVIYITNGKGYLFTSKIINANDKRCNISILKTDYYKNTLNYQLHIAIAPTKNNQRFEWFLEKATEIGISEITPIICEHSERKVIKKERFEKVIISAIKQSKRYYLPKINEAITFTSFVNNDFSGLKFITHCEDEEKNLLKNKLEKREDVIILIGPEGDFSLNEISLALEKNYLAVSLGKSILRTETAGIVAAHSVAFINE